MFADAPNHPTGPGVFGSAGWELTLFENSVLEGAWASIPLIRFIDEYREAVGEADGESA
ncbi:hypothetical protein [Microbacterium sp. NPDC076911]|uniref:hypothetical protein n=1 Tax=Microbacterium sp. NPDC076911 TaxID=3154958 RepID=UPI0034124950